MERFFTYCVVGLFAIAGAVDAEAQNVLFQHTFDNVANDSTPAVQAFDNQTNDISPVVNLTTGLLGENLDTSASGFNTVSGIDLTSLDEFTVEYVVSNNYSVIATARFNGAFFGIVNSSAANNTNGGALYNNAGGQPGTPIGVAIGLQVGTGRGVAGPDFALDQVANNGAFTSIFDPDTEVLDDATDGYSIFVNYANDTATGNTVVTITSTGLATDMNFRTVAEVSYAVLAANVTPNVSCQDGTLDLDRIRITNGPANDLAGDVNGDGVVDCDDANDYVGNLGEEAIGSLSVLDLNTDDMITLADAEMLINQLVVAGNGATGTIIGDINCDGTVNVLGDALVLVTSLGASGTVYTDGDLNFSGNVDVLGDALILVINLGKTNN